MNLAERFQSPPTDRVALIVGERTLTYGQLGERVGCWQGGLAESGLVPGDRVLILAGNSDVFVVGYLAALAAGLVTVPLNPQSPPAELRRDMAAVDASAIVVDAAGLPAWEALQQEGTGEDVDSAGDAALPPHVFVAEADGSLPALDAGTARPVVDVGGDEPAVLLFTSGTAGPPRPAILTHDNLWASMRSIVALETGIEKEHQVALAVIPLFHVFGLNLIINLGISIGATIVLEDHVAPVRTVQLIDEHRVTIVAGPPPLWASLLADPTITPEALESVKLAVSGAAPLDTRIAAEVKDTLGVDISEGYGLTETSGLVASALAAPAPIGSVGSLFPGVEARLVDGQGRDVLVGDPGEVWVRGPAISPGYWGDPDTTASTRTDDGWLRTGDLAQVDDNGNLTIVGRSKDLIIVSGFNVHPAEVEQALTSHPGVAAAGVLGEPDESTGERVVAYVVTAGDAAPTESELIAHCRTQVARYKVPKRVVFTASIPTGVGGKVRRTALEERERGRTPAD